MPVQYLPGQRIDHYRIIRVLGLGLANSVYLAQDVHTLQEVVLKFPHDDEIGGRVIFERFKREEEVGRILDHPAIQRHLNQGETRSRNYLVLEYAEGVMLREVIQKRLPDLLPVAEVVAILSQVCLALAYVHEQGIIHRDMKPENILLLADGEIKILDFNIALFVQPHDARRARLSSLVGTPDYMAPELLLGQGASERSDIYAVGVILYELLCGRTPFAEKDGFAFTSLRLSHDPPTILQWNAQVPANLTTIVMRTIRRDADKRYASMRALLDDLEQLDEVLSVDYVPSPPKFGRRYSLLVRLVAVIMSILLVIIALGILAQFAHHTTP